MIVATLQNGNRVTLAREGTTKELIAEALDGTLLGSAAPLGDIWFETTKGGFISMGHVSMLEDVESASEGSDGD